MNWKDLFDSRKVRTMMIAIVGIYMIATKAESPDLIATLAAIAAITILGSLHTICQTKLDLKWPKGNVVTAEEATLDIDETTGNPEA